MSKVVSRTKFLELVKRSRLIEPDELSQFLVDAKKRHGVGSEVASERLAELMIDERLFTRWQADKLLAGKHKGFFLGKYKLLDQIGKGGMSSVYLAEHTLMHRLVAIKVLPRNKVEDSSYLERFRLEARAVAKLDDPNIVRAYDIDNEGDIHYIVMEYVNGSDLHQIVSKHGPLEVERAIDYIAQAANGLQHAHEHGLVHRDVKPANCLVDRHHVVKILDLGLAKLSEESSSLTLANEENVLGTADFLAPEQALNSHTADLRADIYGLGCTLYYLLTGRPPFNEGSISERLLKHQTASPDSLASLRPEIPGSVIEICERMMEKKAEDRYQTAGEVAEKCSGWLADRGKTLGGGSLDEDTEDSGVGSGLFRRFAVDASDEPSESAAGSETLASAATDTDRVGGTEPEEDIQLAPLEEEAEENISAISGVRPRKGADLSGPLSSPGEEENLAEVELPPDSSKGSLVEEELHDPGEEAIAAKVRQRQQFDPLRPPGYTAPGSGPPWGLILGAIGGGLLLVVIILIMLSGS